MILWFTVLQLVVACAAGLVAIASGLAKRPPGDVTVGGLLLVEVLLIAQVIAAIVAPFTGNVPTGSGLEFWVYLVSALLVPLAGVAWALVERGRWSTVVMGVAALAVAIMVWRMQVIWTSPLA